MLLGLTKEMNTLDTASSLVLSLCKFIILHCAPYDMLCTISELISTNRSKLRLSASHVHFLCMIGYFCLTRVMDNKSLRLITDASVSSPISREKSQGLDPSMRGMPDDFIRLSSCVLLMPTKRSILHFCRQSCIFVPKF